MKEPTLQEIQAEITELRRIKPLICERTAFGDNNWNKIDAIIEVLEKDLTDTDIDDKEWFEMDDDGTPLSEPDWTQEEADGARAAWSWKEGETKEKPSASWQNLVGVKPKFDFTGLGPKEALAMVEADKHQPSDKKKTKKGKK